jgi:hypothetical protein
MSSSFIIIFLFYCSNLCPEHRLLLFIFYIGQFRVDVDGPADTASPSAEQKAAAPVTASPELAKKSLYMVVPFEQHQ